MGEKSPLAKLTNAQANDIRHLYATSEITYKELAFRFGVSQGTIKRIVRNFAYKDLCSSL